MSQNCVAAIAVGLSLAACSNPSVRLEIGVVGHGGTSPCAGSYSYPVGTVLKVTAVPGVGAQFTGWSGEVSGTASEVKVVLDGDQTVVAHFSGGTGAGTSTGCASSSGTGSSGTGSSGTGSSGTGSSGTGSSGTGSSGTGSSGTGSSGTGSSGTGSSGTGSSGISSSGTGSSGGAHALTVSRLGAGTGTVSGAGLDCGSTCSVRVAEGTSATLSAAAAAGSSFEGWGGACSGVARTCTVAMTSDRTVTATFAAARPATFASQVLWQDLADIDIFRVDDTFYYMASNMHYSPGAPILRSFDLVNWEYAGHAVPKLDFSPAYDLNGGRAYIKGTWASFLNYRKSNKTFYFGGLIQGAGDYMYTATAVEGPWEKHRITGSSGYYDAGLLVDDDDKLYVAYGSTNINVAELSADGFSQVRTQKVFTTSFYGEGSRFYKKDGNYYILLTQPASWEYVLRSTTGPFGPYEIRPLADAVRAPVAGAGNPHQGGLVSTSKGDWYYMAFVDAYPGGRIPVLAPVKWVDGWPVLETVNGAWGASYPYPDVPPAPRATKPVAGLHTFEGTKLGPQWEWNHNPDDTRWSLVDGKLRLQAATVTNDLYQARNTLTHRILGPTSTGTIVLDYSGMRDGDRAGLALLRDASAWIGVRKDGGATRLSMVDGLAMDKSWNTTSTGTEVASTPVSGGTIWLRLFADIHPGAGRKARFSYSTDGVTFTPLGNEVTLGNDWPFFMGYRFGFFNFATQALGGSVTVKSFELATP